MDKNFCLHNINILTGFSVMKDCAIYVQGNKIKDVYNEARLEQKDFYKKVKMIDGNGATLAPGFMDTHIHGIGGYSTDDADYKSILGMSETLAHYGVTSFIPTISATAEDLLIPKIKAILKAMGKEKGATILGIHLEGPFLSPKRIGGQEFSGISPVDLDYMARICKAAKGHIINMTVAPELKGMRELSLYCLQQGIILQAGHTDATYKQMIEAMQVNIMHVTHMFNAMRPLHHREPGTVGAALTHREISCEIIGDGVHVAPTLFPLLLKTKPLSQLVLITDSLKYAKADIPPNADFYFDKCFKRKADEVIIGSGISMLDGFKNLMSFGLSPEEAIQMAAANPARIMKQSGKGLLLPGYDADFIVFDKNFDIIHTFVNGKMFKEKN